MGNRVLMLCDDDSYELPVAIFNSARECGEWLGMTKDSILTAICKKQRVKRKYRLEWILID